MAPRWWLLSVLRSVRHNADGVNVGCFCQQVITAALGVIVRFRPEVGPYRKFIAAPENAQNLFQGRDHLCAADDLLLLLWL
ncbi:hypothetical protein KCP69_10005 [Salmonella enterica subsp. enterica]|nr:hypothetical protein KCP69_10005 [Salmonella enterica subsp. enterica]